MRNTASTVTVAVTLAVVALAGCGGDDDAPVAEDEPVTVESSDESPVPVYGLVSPDEAAELTATDDITVIDVRTPAEYAEGHIDGATLIDFYEPTFADKIAELDPDGEYLVYCRSGNRSGQAYALMQELGFDRVYDLDGGVVGAAGSSLTLVE